MAIRTYIFLIALWTFSLFLGINSTQPSDTEGVKYTDTHMHLYDQDLTYTSVNPEALHMQSDYTVETWESDTESTPVKYGVAVESAAQDWEAELNFLFEKCNQYDSIVGIIAGIPLDHPSFEQAIEKHTEGYKEQLLVGVRNFARRANLFYPDKSLWQALQILQKKGKVLDILVRSSELEQFAAVAAAFPNLTIVLEHISLPFMEPTLRETWQRGMSRMAGYSNVHVKLSALFNAEDMAALKKGKIRTNNTEAKFQEFKPYVQYVLKAFGAERVIFGTDWPVSQVGYDSYATVYHFTSGLLESLTETDRRDIFYANAVKIYRLDLTSGVAGLGHVAQMLESNCQTLVMLTFALLLHLVSY